MLSNINYLANIFSKYNKCFNKQSSANKVAYILKSKYSMVVLRTLSLSLFS